MLKMENASTVKIDPRIVQLIQGSALHGQRCVCVVVGRNAQWRTPRIWHLHNEMKLGRSARRNLQCDRNILWCYDNKSAVNLTSHQTRRMKRSKGNHTGTSSSEESDSFTKFLSQNQMTFVKYRDVARVTGDTYSMLVLTDFESLTPTVLAQTVETVQTGGVIVLIVDSDSAIQHLESLIVNPDRMDRDTSIVARARLTARIAMSLQHCPAALFITDEWTVLEGIKDFSPPTKTDEGQASVDEDKQLAQVKTELTIGKDSSSVEAKLLYLTETLDQARVTRELIRGIPYDEVLFTVTGGRGRGKSATLGLGVAVAIHSGAGRVDITAPTLAEAQQVIHFAARGLNSLGYDDMVNIIFNKPHVEAQVKTVSHTAPPGASAFVDGLTITRPSTQTSIGADSNAGDDDEPVAVVAPTVQQTVRYISPAEAARSTADVLFIDEAGGISDRLLPSLLDHPRVVIASTTSGMNASGAGTTARLASFVTSATPHPHPIGLTLTKPVRYHKADPVEGWLHGVLCLDVDRLGATPTPLPGLEKGKGLTFTDPADHTHTPDRDAAIRRATTWDLYSVDLTTLTSTGPGPAEDRLRDTMAVLAGSGGAAPETLQTLTDGPGQRLFILYNAKHDMKSGGDVVAAIQVNLEGAIRKAHRDDRLAHGMTDLGDTIPWIIASHHKAANRGTFSRMTGARVVKVAVHPAYRDQEKVIAAAAMERLEAFYRGDLRVEGVDGGSGSDDAVLMRSVCLTVPEPVDWLATSHPATEESLIFWGGLGFTAVHVDPTPGTSCVEPGVVLIKSLERGANVGWVDVYRHHFIRSTHWPSLTAPLPVVYLLLEAPACFEPTHPAPLPTIAAAVSGVTLTEGAEGGVDLTTPAAARFMNDLAALRRYGTGRGGSYGDVQHMLPTLASLAVSGRLSPFESSPAPPDVATLSATLISLCVLRRPLTAAASEVVALRLGGSGREQAVLLSKVVNVAAGFAAAIDLLVERSCDVEGRAGKRARAE